MPNYRTRFQELLRGNPAEAERLESVRNVEVERLQEYRTALITAAVTAKIDSRKANQ